MAHGLRVVTTTTTRVTLRQLELAPAHLRLTSSALPVDDLARALDAHSHCLLVGNETLLNGKQTGLAPEMVDALVVHAARLGIGAIVLEADGSRTLPVKVPANHEPVVPQSSTLLVPVVGLDAVGAPVDDAHAHRAARMRALLEMGDVPAPLTPSQAVRLLLHPNGGAKGLPQAARLLPVFNKAEAPARLAVGRICASVATASGAPTLIAAAGREDGEPVLERWGAVAVILLAAGASRRFGAPKQAALVDGEPMARRAARTALASGAQHVVMVTGAHAALVQEAVADLADPRLQLVHNPEWAQGQSTSLRAGLAALPHAVQAVICLPVDQPWVEPALLRRMIALWRSGSDIVAPIADGVLRGAPALFDCSHFGALAAVTGDQGGRVLLARHTVTTLPVDAATLADVDAPEDLHI